MPLSASIDIAGIVSTGRIVSATRFQAGCYVSGAFHNPITHHGSASICDPPQYAFSRQAASKPPAFCHAFKARTERNGSSLGGLKIVRNS